MTGYEQLIECCHHIAAALIATARHVISQGGGSRELISDAVGQSLLTAERCVRDTIRQAEEACHDRQETDRAL